MHKYMNSRTQKEINVKVHKCFNVVRPIMPTSTDEKKSFRYAKNQSTRLEYQFIVTTRKNTKS